ncbi:hypothetical protein AVEN_114353-1, partial [Araneus ventricosus]
MGHASVVLLNCGDECDCWIVEWNIMYVNAVLWQWVMYVNAVL